MPSTSTVDLDAVTDVIMCKFTWPWCRLVSKQVTQAFFAAFGKLCRQQQTSSVSSHRVGRQAFHLRRCQQVSPTWACLTDSQTVGSCAKMASSSNAWRTTLMAFRSAVSELFLNVLPNYLAIRWLQYRILTAKACVTLVLLFKAGVIWRKLCPWHCRSQISSGICFWTLSLTTQSFTTQEKVQSCSFASLSTFAWVVLWISLRWVCTEWLLWCTAIRQLQTSVLEFRDLCFCVALTAK